MLFGMLISLIWGHKVFLNASHMISCHVIASWYFSPDEAESGCPCCRPVTCVGLKRSLINYLGSIAFGSLIVAIVEAFYYTCKYVVEKTLAGTNPIVKFIACCFLCLLNCLKNTIEWLTEWAYVYIAIYGVSFIEAGGKVAKMLGSSGMGAIAQTTLVHPVIMLGRICGAAIGVGAGYLSLESFMIENTWSQPFLGACVGFAITSVSLSCVDAGNKTMFVCYVDAPELMAERMPEVHGVFTADERNKIHHSSKAAEPDEVKVHVQQAA
mmetsp:Transcript_57773/g.114710  ORF Transcript_57773/g.114710 Transcript_57773/m.114710 type:complete len:268 (-) Transcript_57773:161-964(-)